jgi:hypothetical protein
MTLRFPLFFFTLAIAALLPPAAFSQAVAPPEQPVVTGSCVVSLGANVFRRENCTLSTSGENTSVPAGSLLVIEHVSAACATTPERGIFSLALLTRLSAEGPARVVHVPVRLQSMTRDQMRLSGGGLVRIHAGPDTQIGMLVSTFASAPAGETTCDISFSGILQRMNQ